MQPWTGIRILDLSHWLGSYAGRLFADLGAEVIRVEPPGGLRDRATATPGAFGFLNASKSSVILDLDAEDGLERFVPFATTAQVVILEHDGPLWDRAEDLAACCPTLVVTCVSPFGRTGPRARAPASDLTLQAAGGIAWMSGRIDAAPLRLPFGQAAMIAGTYAATATAMCLHDAERRDRGHVIDVSAQEAIAHSLQNAVQVWDLEQRVSTRGGEGTRDATEDVFPCRDGFVFLAAPPALPNSWAGIVGWMKDVGHPSGEALSAPRWSDREWRKTREAKAMFRVLFTAFTETRTKAELRQGAMVRRVVMAPVARFADLPDDPQLSHRGFFRQVGDHLFPGPPYRLSEPVWQISPAPALGHCRPDPVP
ncbi:MAG: CoA transferase [Jannaschia sp.]